MKKQIWIKATLAISGTNPSSGPQWVGINENGDVLASPRWDIPAGTVPFKDLIESRVEEHIKTALKHPPKNKTFVTASPTIAINLDDPFGHTLDDASTATLEGIEVGNMAWINTPERKKLSDNFGRVALPDTMAIVQAVASTGVPVSLTSNAPSLRRSKDIPE